MRVEPARWCLAACPAATGRGCREPRWGTAPLRAPAPGAVAHACAPGAWRLAWHLHGRAVALGLESPELLHASRGGRAVRGAWRHVLDLGTVVGYNVALTACKVRLWWAFGAPGRCRGAGGWPAP